MERQGSPVEELPPLQSLDDCLPNDWKYLADRASERMEHRRSTPEGRAAVEQENEKALENFLSRPIESKDTKSVIPPITMKEVQDIQQKIRGLSEQFLAQQAMLPKDQYDRRR